MTTPSPQDAPGSDGPNQDNVARLLSVNVGLPRDIAWRGRTVHTGIWKNPVQGRCRVSRLNVDGDGQGDLAGHGGEQRAVYVYQADSYRYWQEQLHRSDFVPGQFGENFTVEGLSDDAVCIGDRYQIGTALFEVTQPRVTCYRVGIRMDEPLMPSLLTSRGRPGFYLRVLQEGEVGAGDAIVKVGEDAVRMTVAEANALLYSPHHPPDRLADALRITALSSGWRGSFEALLSNAATAGGGGNAGLMPAAAAHAVTSGFRALQITGLEWECDDVVSLTMADPDRVPLLAALPGQYVVLRLRAAADGPPLLRSYSLSGGRSTERYRISVKVEPGGAAGAYLGHHLGIGDRLDVSLPRGSFILQAGDRPVVLLSAGIGVTPVLAMLYSLVESRSTRQVLWIHQGRDRQHHPFALEARRLIGALANGRHHVCYSQPGTHDVVGQDFDGAGHLSQSVLDQIQLPHGADIYLCGPNRFMADMKQALASIAVAPNRIHVELFNGGESMTPGITALATRPPHRPEHEPTTGALVSFARSGVAARWGGDAYQSLLELAEACDVPVRWSCRSGVCHNCESGLVSGAVAYGPEPLDPPAEGNLLLCCSRPVGDVVIDL